MDRKTLSLIALIILVAGLNWLFPVHDDTPDSIEGRARVIDGDSVVVDGYEVRMVGIDAPEGRQKCQREGREWPCGEVSTRGLRKLTDRKTVKCAVEGRDKHRRLLAVCMVGNRDLNRAQVRNGLAVSYGRYKNEEHDAREDKKGVWSGTFEYPKAWRDKNF